MIGVSIECFVGNTYLSASITIGLYDVIFGLLANLIAAALIFKLRNRRLVGCVLGLTVIGLIVGSYEWMIFGRTEDIRGFKIP